MRGLCLLGETMGLIADPRAAKAVLHVLLPVLGLRLSFENLEEKAKEIEEMMQKLKKEMERRERAEKEELFYIG
jgi:proteasome assembly chaperone (PAC2) family protein